MNLDSNSVLFAFALTLFAGLSTGIGSFIALFVKRTNTKFLAAALGFSAGVMIYVSFVEIFMKAMESLTEELGEVAGTWATVGAFFAGMFFIAIIDRLIPMDKEPHGFKVVESDKGAPQGKNLLRMGMFTALAIAIHNFPEGLITFTAAIKDPTLGIAIAVAIAIHNIPEGVAVSVPIYYATGSKKKAFAYSFISGLAEPLGAVIGFLILRIIFSEVIFGVLFASVAGIMVFISLDELLPTAKKYDQAHLSIYGLIVGMIVMALSILLFL